MSSFFYFNIKEIDVKMISKNLTKKIIDTVLAKYSCRKLILFGSQARGTGTNKSDIDLLVVIDSPKNKFGLMDKISRDLIKLGYPFDIVVQSSKEFEREKNFSGTISRHAFLEGKLLYEE